MKPPYLWVIEPGAVIQLVYSQKTTLKKVTGTPPDSIHSKNVLILKIELFSFN